MKLSIIIPVYNVEKYIAKCIMSCVNQDISLDDYEIIIINDGTKDNSLDVVNTISKGISNIRVYSQENSGLSVARNNGLSYAKGDYIWFVDSDDYIEDNCLKNICNFLDGELDLLQIQFKYVYENGSPCTYDKKYIIDGVKEGKDVLINTGVSIPAQFTIYRREFLLDNNLQFYPHIYHEDVDFKPRAVYLAKRMTSYNEVVYNYLQRDSSIMAKMGMKNACDLIFISERMYDFCKNVKAEAIPYFSSVIAGCINWVLIIMCNLSREDKRQIKTMLKEKKHLIKAMKFSDTKQYMYEAYLLLFNLGIGRRAYLLLRQLPQYGPNRIKEK
ncbi:MAG: glycosyltransferase [Bacteroidales bacterium]|nr:glycosyltransferase [Bacteroidales bacterium]